MSQTSLAPKVTRWYQRVTGAKTPPERLVAAFEAVRALAALLDDCGGEEEAAEMLAEVATAVTEVFLNRLTSLGVAVPSAPAPVPEGTSPR